MNEDCLASLRLRPRFAGFVKSDAIADDRA